MKKKDGKGRKRKKKRKKKKKKKKKIRDPNRQKPFNSVFILQVC